MIELLAENGFSQKTSYSVDYKSTSVNKINLFKLVSKRHTLQANRRKIVSATMTLIYTL